MLIFSCAERKNCTVKPITAKAKLILYAQTVLFGICRFFRREILWDGKAATTNHLSWHYRGQTGRRSAESIGKRISATQLGKSPLGIRVRDKDGQHFVSKSSIPGYVWLQKYRRSQNTPAARILYAWIRMRIISYARINRQHGESLPDAMEIDIKRNDGTMRHLQVLRREVLWDGKAGVPDSLQRYHRTQAGGRSTESIGTKLPQLFGQFHSSALISSIQMRPSHTRIKHFWICLVTKISKKLSITTGQNITLRSLTPIFYCVWRKNYKVKQFQPR